MNQFLIIDFDSTFIKVEALEILSLIIYKEHKRSVEMIEKIREITRLGMIGNISFAKSLSRRIKLLKPKKEQIEELTKVLIEEITPSFNKNISFFLKNKDRIYVISGGFRDWVLPICLKFGIEPSHVLTNDFIYSQNEIVGYDKNNVLCKHEGKAKAVNGLKLEGEVIVLGDGYTDYEIKEKCIADKFYAFTENIKRNEVVQKSDGEVKNLDEFLLAIGLN